jgi:hypothetical protein
LADAKTKVKKRETELTEEQKRVGQVLEELAEKRVEAHTAQARDNRFIRLADRVTR